MEEKKQSGKKVWETEEGSGERNQELRMRGKGGGGWCNQLFGTGQEKSAGRTEENVYQCPLQLCLQLFQLSGDSV